MFNEVYLVGRMGDQPQMTETKNGTKRARGRFVTWENWKDSEGQKQETSMWHTVVAWGELAAHFSDLCSQGRLVLIKGNLINKTFDNENGVTQYSSYVKVNSFKLLESLKSIKAIDEVNSWCG